MLHRIAHVNGVVSYQSPKLEHLGVVHAFSTRIGGVSEGPYASLNLATLEKSPHSDFNTSVSENFRRFRRALGVERRVRSEVKQVHGAEVWEPPPAPIRPQEAPEADALMSDRPDKLLTVRTADCVPVLLSGPQGQAVAAVHAGWRGLVAGVVAAAVTRLGARFGVAPETLTAAIGPAIGVAHFEVGEEVAERFIEAGLAKAVDRSVGEKPHLALAEAALIQLLDAGAAASQVDASDRCTYQDEAEFYSHRRDEGVTGRHAAVIAARAA
jgi:YfiH family protein